MHFLMKIFMNNYFREIAVVCHQDHGTSRGHFHCPSCEKIIKRKENARLHVAKCSETKRDDSGRVKADVAQDKQNDHFEHSYSRPAKEPQDKSSIAKKPCPICKKFFH